MSMRSQKVLPVRARVEKLWREQAGALIAISLTGLVVLSLILAGCWVVFSPLASQKNASSTSQESVKRERALSQWAAELGIDVSSDTQQSRPHNSQIGAPLPTASELKEDAITDAIRQKLSQEEVRSYYDAHLDQFARQDTLELTVTRWEKGRMVASSEVSLDDSNVRVLQEENDAVISAALDLHSGESATIPLADDVYMQVECRRRESGGVYPFEDVAGAASQQLAREHFATELASRVN